MEIIKENTFFVVMGVVVLVALALFFVLVEPMKRANAAKQLKVEKLTRSIADLINAHDREEEKKRSGKPMEVKNILPNEATLRFASEYHRKWVDETDKVVGKLQSMKLLNSLNEVFEEMSSIKVDVAEFKVIYADHVRDLKERLVNKNIYTTRETWAFWDWGAEMPNSEVQRELAAKEFIIIAELVDIIELPTLSVRQVDRLEVNPGISRSSSYVAARTRDRLGDYFVAHPFVMSVKMDLAKRELLIDELLKSDLKIFIRAVNMERVPQDPAIYGKTDQVFVGIKVEGWVLDYEEKPKESGPMPVMGRSGKQ